MNARAAAARVSIVVACLLITDSTREYAATLARDAETRDFAGRFFLATALGWQIDGCFEDALAWAHAGLELFPRDAELHLAAGSVLEERRWPMRCATATSCATRPKV